jgi:hypothetical protein
MCKSWCEVILGLIILVFTFVEQDWAKWVVAVAAVMLIIHSFTCKACFHGGMGDKKTKYYSKKGRKG